MILIELDPQLTALVRSTRGLTSRFGPVIAGAMATQNELTVGYIQQRKLSQRGSGTLGVVTNRLRGSVRATAPVIAVTEVSSSLGTNVKYAAVHEYGCEPYTIRARNGKALRFLAGGSVRFARTVRHPGFQGRHMFQSGVEENADAYAQAFGDAIFKEINS